jgi:hypothetical protein
MLNSAGGTHDRVDKGLNLIDSQQEKHSAELLLYG